MRPVDAGEPDPSPVRKRQADRFVRLAHDHVHIDGLERVDLHIVGADSPTCGVES
jgi:hypothetical protein